MPKRSQHKLSPKQALQREFTETLSFNAKLRTLMTSQIREIKLKLMDDTLPIDTRLLLLDGLSKIIAQQAKSLDGTAKYVISGEDDEAAAKPTDAENLKDAIAALKGK